MHSLLLFDLDETLSGATTPGQSGLKSDGNEGILRISKRSSITGTSPSDWLVSYPEYSLGGVLPLCRDVVGVFYSPSQLGPLSSMPWRPFQACQLRYALNWTICSLASSKYLSLFMLSFIFTLSSPGVHEWVGKIIHKELCKRSKVDHTIIVENEKHKILWDFEIRR